jgi:hypothetical protein
LKFYQKHPEASGAGGEERSRAERRVGWSGVEWGGMWLGVELMQNFNSRIAPALAILRLVLKLSCNEYSTVNAHFISILKTVHSLLLDCISLFDCRNGLPIWWNCDY